MSLLNEPLFDSSALDEIRELEADGETGLLDDLINNYKRESQELMNSLKGYLAADQRLDAERTAHSLKSSSRLIGAIRLSVAMAEMEELARDLKLAECKAKFEAAALILQESLPVIVK